MRLSDVLVLALGSCLLCTSLPAQEAEDLELGKKILRCREQCRKSAIRRIRQCLTTRRQCVAACESKKEARTCIKACARSALSCAGPAIERYVITCRKTCLGGAADDSLDDGQDVSVQGVIVTRPD